MVKIILNGIDLTSKIKNWEITKQSEGHFKLTVEYLSGKKFFRPLEEWNVCPVKEISKALLYNKTKKSVHKIEKAVEYGEKYVFITYPRSDKQYVMNVKDVEILKSSSLNEGSVYEYFTQIASERVRNSKNEDDKVICENIVHQFDKIVPYTETAMNAYISKQVQNREKRNNLIYPFGINETQMEAVQNAFMSQISVIEGPPGTGKTQTILNIIANILVDGKTCAIVSNNNPAVENVYEKMEKVELEFLIAKLGSTANREKFFKDETKKRKSIDFVNNVTLDDIQNILHRLKGNLSIKNDLARIEAEIKEVEIEKDYLMKWANDHPELGIHSINKYKLSSKKTVDLQAYIHVLADNRLSFKEKFDLMIRFKIFRNKFLDDLESRQKFVFSLQITYYEKVLKEKTQRKVKLVEYLENADFEKDMQILKTESLNYLYQYVNNVIPMNKPNYTTKNYKEKFHEFMSYYPIVGGSTHSLLNSIGTGYILDYVIIDEASQQDIVPGILCFGCARNVIIVGDRKQLAHIPTSTNISCPESLYDCEQYSLLDSVSEVFQDSVPRTLLKEHYRCHPKIIQFCNKQFYENQLIPMTKDKGEDSLSLIRTALGNHTRNNANQREIDSLIKVQDESVCIKDNIGFIAPYNSQVNLAEKMLPSEIVKATIHKFQGRECDEIVFSTVLDKKRRSIAQIDFVDNASLVNVAVSRAKNKFTLVTGNNVFTSNNKHIAALIRYIEYYGKEKDCYNSPVISAFDLLYTEYDKSLEKLNMRLNPNDSKFKSEQIVSAILRDMFVDETFKGFIFHREVVLMQLVSTTDNCFTDEEKKFMIRARCDFVIYYEVGKRALTVIEVDGAYHQLPEQMERDRKKNNILEKAGIPLLRLPTTTGEIEVKIEEHIRSCIELSK